MFWRYLWLQWRDITGGTCGCNGGILLAVPVVAMEGYYWKYLWLQLKDITGGTCGYNGGILPAVSVV
jgi:hypothetical protein